MKDNYLVQAWLVLSLALLFGSALAGVQAGLGDKIQANKLAETLQQLPSLVEGATGGQKMLLDGRTVYRAIDADGRQVGWVVPARGQGFADTIELLIGLDARAERITGLYVLAQKETPGLGSKITAAQFSGQFGDKMTDPALTVVKSEPRADNEIAAVTGATISSEGVTKIVNDTVAELGRKLAAAAN